MKRGTIRLGFSPAARAAFDSFSNKVRSGIRRKLRDFGEDPAVGKPLVGALQGYHRITYGRVRTVSLRIIAKVEDDLVIVYVLHIGLRKAGASDDPYEIATAALARQDREALDVLEALVEQLHAGELHGLTEPEAE